jgi:redox-sensitive bicupin YhaK (pirin superfamily)
MNPIERIASRPTDLGDGMVVRRALPTRARRMVGAWCFLDHLGPVDFAPDGGMHVGAHPHIGLQTFTWLMEGEVRHRDSLGSDQIIRPGQVNLMTAGRGIVHTEDSVVAGGRLHAAQLWIALPPQAADCEPAFEHFPDLPRWDEHGCAFTLVAGSFAGRTMSARFHSPLLGLDVCSLGGATFALSLDPAFEHGILPLEGDVRIGNESFAMDEFAYLAPGTDRVDIALAAGSRILLLGGEPFPEPVLMWWNFVGWRKDAIAEAQRDWEAGNPRFGRVAGDGGRRLIAPALPWTGY